MRKLPTLKSSRRALTVTTFAALLTGGAFLSSGTAFASQTTVTNTCQGTVTSRMGDQIALDGAGVKGLVTQGANNAGTAAIGSWAGDSIAGIHSIPLANVPSAANGAISGAVIGKAVRDALANSHSWGLGLDWNKTLNSVESTVANACGLTMFASDYVAPSTPGTGTGTNGGTPTTPGSTGGPLSNLVPDASGGTAPRRDYSNIPVAAAGEAVAPGIRYGQNGALPGDASVPQGGQDAQSGQSGQGADIRAAGNAESLASPGGTDDVQLPMLLAVIVLAGVTAGLVRTWVLRRAS